LPIKQEKKLNPQKRDRVPITQRDLARTYVHPPETNLGRTFNLKDYKEKKIKKEVEKFCFQLQKELRYCGNGQKCGGGH